MKLRHALAFVFAGLLAFLSTCVADEPGWLNVVVARGELRQQIHDTPILERPYRPLHFYGNAVRRAYYHGSLQRGAAVVQQAAPAAPAQQ